MKSFYKDRLNEYFDRVNWDQIVEDKTENGSIVTWLGNTRYPAMNMRLVARNYHEEIYKGFHVVVIEWVRHLNRVLDKNGDIFDRHIKEDEIVSYCPTTTWKDYGAFAYLIGDFSDQIANLGFSDQFSFLKGIGTPNSLEKTLSKAKKKLDLYDKLNQIKPDLIQLVNDRLSYNKGEVPYNAKIGDQVFVQGHGCMRKGIIVDTTSNKFVVGYLTPSNLKDFHWKTLPLSELRIKV